MGIRIASRVLLAVLTAVVSGACGQQEDAFAVVGRGRLEIQSFQAHVTSVTGEAWQAVEGRVASRLLDQFLDQELVAAAARRRREVRIPAEPGERSAAVRSLLEEVCGPPPSPSTEAAEQEVARRLTTIRPASARVRHMLLDDREGALAARARLADGEDFVALSQELSRAANAASGGDLGMVRQGRLPEEVDVVIFSLPAGGISDVVESTAGYHVFQVLEVISPGPPDRADVEAQVQREMREERAMEFTRECLDSLAREIGVRVEDEFLWFRYDGRYAEDEHAME